MLVIEGWKPSDRFNASIEFGNLWHACEEGHASRQPDSSNVRPPWESALDACARQLAIKYPFQREEITCWYAKAKALFPEYVKHWAQHPDVQARTPLLQEQVFRVPYQLPSGRTVQLRGKWDSVDLVGEGKDAAVWLQENKSKSGIDPQKIQRQLVFDLQTLTYLVALNEWLPRNRATVTGAGSATWHKTVAGVRFNVVRRAAHKTADSMMEKLQLDQRCGRAGEWFARWNVEVNVVDIARFKRECLDPVLENLVDDFEWWEMSKLNGHDPFDFGKRGMLFSAHDRRHFRTPYTYNPLSEGGFGDVDEYVNTGSTVGLTRVEDLFPELKEGA